MLHNVACANVAAEIAEWGLYFKHQGTFEIGWTHSEETSVIPFKGCDVEALLKPKNVFGLSVRCNFGSHPTTDLVVESTFPGEIPDPSKGLLFYPTGNRFPAKLGAVQDRPPINPEAWTSDTIDVYLTSYVMAVLFKDTELQNTLLSTIKVTCEHFVLTKSLNLR